MPIAIAQRNSAPVGVLAGGMLGTESENVPKPGPGVEPDEDERTHAGRDQARDQDHAQQGTAQAGHFHQEEGADDRRTEQGRDRGEAPGHPEDHDRHRRRVPLEKMDRQDTETAADRDQGRLRAEHDPEAQGHEGGQHDPGKLDRRDRPAGLETVGRRVAASSGEVLDRERNEEPAECEERSGPPGRRAVEAEVVRQRREDVLLRLGDQLQEEVRRGCDRDTDDRAQHEQPDIAVALEQLDGIRRRRRFRWVRGTRHSFVLASPRAVPVDCRTRTGHVKDRTRNGGCRFGQPP